MRERHAPPVAANSLQRLERRLARELAGQRKGSLMRKTITGLLRSFRPVLLMTALVAVVGVTGTAYTNYGHGGQKSDSSGAAQSQTMQSELPGRQVGQRRQV